MIITQAPVRVSFFGGGTDFPQHMRKHGGVVLSTAINRFAYTTVQEFNHKFFDHRLRISYRKTETPRNVEEIENPAIRACCQKLKIEDGVELHYMADLPARTGLGSSSSFVVGMLLALHAFQGRFRAACDLAKEAIEVERFILKETGGYQDQIIAAYGGLCLIRFDKREDFSVTQLSLARERIEDLQQHMLLLYTGIQRDSYTVLDRQVAGIDKNQEHLLKMGRLAEEAAGVLCSDAPILQFGEMLHESWRLKKMLSDVSLSAIDRAYDIACSKGATGGKLLGAGQGGFLLMMANPADHDRICAALPEMPPVKARINAPGARVIFSQ